jgi:hypothetical protein
MNSFNGIAIDDQVIGVRKLNLNKVGAVIGFSDYYGKRKIDIMF